MHHATEIHISSITLGVEMGVTEERQKELSKWLDDLIFATIRNFSSNLKNELYQIVKSESLGLSQKTKEKIDAHVEKTGKIEPIVSKLIFDIYQSTSISGAEKVWMLICFQSAFQKATTKYMKHQLSEIIEEIFS